MTTERRKELKRLADAATPGPWEHRGCRYDDDLYSDTAKPGDPYFNHQRISCGGSVRVTMCDMGKLDDLWFILESRTAVPELLAALEEAERENARLRARVETLEAAATEYRDSVYRDIVIHFVTQKRRKAWEAADAHLRAALEGEPE